MKEIQLSIYFFNSHGITVFVTSIHIKQLLPKIISSGSFLPHTTTAQLNFRENQPIVGNRTSSNRSISCCFHVFINPRIYIIRSSSIIFRNWKTQYMDGKVSCGIFARTGQSESRQNAILQKTSSKP